MQPKHSLHAGAPGPYLAGLGLDTGWLVIFDQRAGQPRIAERTTTTTALTPAGRAVTVIRP